MHISELEVCYKIFYKNTWKWSSLNLMWKKLIFDWSEFQNNLGILTFYETNESCTIWPDDFFPEMVQTLAMFPPVPRGRRNIDR